MSTSYTGLSTTSPADQPVLATVPADGDLDNAASWVPALQALADYEALLTERIAFLAYSNWFLGSLTTSAVSVACNNFGTTNQFLAFGGTTMLSSPDGVAWTARTSNATVGINSAAWSGSLWVAVGGGGTTANVISSPDGITWTARTGAVAAIMNAVAWSPVNSLFVAVGAGGSMQTSPDGITWTSRTSGAGANTLWAVACSSAGVCVAVGDGGTVVSSANGTSWTLRSAPFSTHQTTSVIWSSKLGLFLAIDNTSIVASSPDGTTWTTRSTMGSSFFAGGCLLSIPRGVLLIGFNAAAGYMAISQDGINWKGPYRLQLPILPTGVGQSFAANSLNGQLIMGSTGGPWRSLAPSSL